MTRNLYLHIPFCQTICPYCDFYSLANLDHQIESYVQALIREMPKWQAGPLKTIFFGGGTPSKLSAEQMLQILQAAVKNFGFDSNMEVTVECNPGTINLQKLKEFKSAGVNRISLGVQTLDESELKKLGREHSVSDSLQSLENITLAGFENFSCDLMLGIPGQSLSSYMKTLEHILKFQPKHLSCYMLKVEEGTPFHEKQKSLNLPEDDETVRMYLQGSEYLESKGLEHYEISNFAKPGFEARHNLAIWNGEDYLGLGTGAHSCVADKRFWFPQNLSGFLAGKLQIENLGIRDAFDDFSLQIRLKSGVNLKNLKINRDFEHILEKYQQLSWLQLEGGFLRLTQAGRLFSNRILSEFLQWFQSAHLSGTFS